MRNMVDFRQVNLIKPFATLGAFDAILCRNILIYFDNSAKAHIIHQFYDMLSNGGFLILGVTENLHTIPERSDGFESIRHGDTLIYKKPPIT